MRLFKNENYTDFYTEPPVLSLEDVLYVEVNMERPLVSDIDSSSNVSSKNSNHAKTLILLIHGPSIDSSPSITIVLASIALSSS